ncbi:hypothetical protein Taro_049391 [Colocasia esculenta]|uniref:Uncharacterized protein n=1 Tax=Colocasia esculenta TaxID=4460 RepID=A0A843XAV2_COLES|nr:hypothetical protein [Colocasia esculenta]
MKTEFTVSIQSQAVSTLFPCSVDTSLSSQKNSFAEMGQCVDTLPSGVDTLRLKLKNVDSGFVVLECSGQKLVVSLVVEGHLVEQVVYTPRLDGFAGSDKIRVGCSLGLL